VVEVNLKHFAVAAIIGSVIGGVGAYAAGSLTTYHIIPTGLPDGRVFDPPCLPGEVTQSASPVLVEQNKVALVFFVCHEAGPFGTISRVRTKTFNVVGIGPVVPVPPPAPTPSYGCSHIPGFVSNYLGNGCVPPDHPDAAK